MTYEVRITQGGEVHTYFTDAIEYVAVPVNDGTKTVMLECIPQNGHQRDARTFFPLHQILSVTERES